MRRPRHHFAGAGLVNGQRRVLARGGPAAASAEIIMPASVWAFGASSMAGAQVPASPNGGTDDSLTDVVRAIEGLPAGSLAYTTVGGSQTNRPIDYNLTGANAAHKIRNRGVGGSTSGSGGTIVSTMTAAAGGFGASDFMVLHQGDNGIAAGQASAVELLAGGYEAMRTQAGARPFVQIVNTQGGRGSAGAAAGEPPGSYFALLKAASYRVQDSLNPGKIFNFHHTLLERSTAADANDTADLGNGFAPRSYMMDDGSHQIAKGYGLQAAMVLLPVIDAWAGGTPFPLRQVIEAQAPAVPAAGDAIGSIVAYGSGGSFALDSSNAQTDYAVASNGAVTRIGAVPPARDITWAAVKTSKTGRFDKMQPLIGIAERAASGVSKLVEFDGKCVIGMPTSTLANSAKLTVLFRVRATDQSAVQIVLGGTNQCRIEMRTNGTLDVVWRNAAATVIVSKTTAANFGTASADRWVALCIDLTDPAAEVTKLVTWAVPATATSDVAVHANLTADAVTAHLARLDTAMAIGFSSTSAVAGSVFAKMRIGDLTLWRDFIDFSVQATREIVSDAAGLPQAAWVSGGGVVSAKTPDLRLAGNAADFRLCRATGLAAPATPGAAGQYLGFNNQRRADLEWGYLSTVA